MLLSDKFIYWMVYSPESDICLKIYDEYLSASSSLLFLFIFVNVVCIIYSNFYIWLNLSEINCIKLCYFT
jgi:hypothetical protein